MMVCSLLPSSASAAFDERTHRTVYLHAQGENPDGTNSSTVYMVDTAGICFDPEYLDSPNPAKLNRMKEYLTKLDDEQLEKLSKNISALPLTPYGL